MESITSSDLGNQCRPTHRHRAGVTVGKQKSETNPETTGKITQKVA